MQDYSKLYLDYIVLQANALIDQGLVASFDEVQEAIRRRCVIEWLDARGADMRLLLSDAMSESRTLVADRIVQASALMKGKEGRKLKVRNNGLCLLIALAIEAKLDRLS